MAEKERRPEVDGAFVERGSKLAREEPEVRIAQEPLERPHSTLGESASTVEEDEDWGRSYADDSDLDGRHLFRGFMANWPTGVTVLTTQVGAQPLGCTAQSLISVSLESPQLLVSLAETSRTVAGLRRSGLFGLSILRAGQAELGQRFSVGTAQERFRGTAVKTVHGVPVLVGAAAAMVCRLGETWQRADHVLVIGLPIWQEVDRGADLLLRHRSMYWRTAPHPHQ